MARPDPEIEALLRRELAGRVVLLLEAEAEGAKTKERGLFSQPSG